MSAFENLEFDTEGTGVGNAGSWTFTKRMADVFASFEPPDGSLAQDPVAEGFENGWDANEDNVFAFAGAAAQYATTHVTAKYVENFEDGWDSNEDFVDEFVGTAAVYSYTELFDPVETEFESFDAGWSSNHNNDFEFAIGTAGAFGGTGGAEDFEQDWSANEDNEFEFTGTPAEYDGDDFDNFEADWPLMTTIV